MKKSLLNVASFFQKTTPKHFISLAFTLIVVTIALSSTAASAPYFPNNVRRILTNQDEGSLEGFLMFLNGTNISAILNNGKINSNSMNGAGYQVLAVESRTEPADIDPLARDEPGMTMHDSIGLHIAAA